MKKQFEAREGDWDCIVCHNNNFAWRVECKRCNANKDGTPGTPGGSDGQRGGGRGGFSRGGRGGSRGAPRGGRGAPRGGRGTPRGGGGFNANRSFGGFDSKPENKKITFDD